MSSDHKHYIQSLEEHIQALEEKLEANDAELESFKQLYGDEQMTADRYRSLVIEAYNSALSVIQDSNKGFHTPQYCSFVAGLLNRIISNPVKISRNTILEKESIGRYERTMEELPSLYRKIQSTIVLLTRSNRNEL